MALSFFFCFEGSLKAIQIGYMIFASLRTIDSIFMIFTIFFPFFVFSLFSGSGDKSVKQWNSQNGECLNTFLGHENFVYGVCLSPDAKLVFSASLDKSCRMWEVTQNETTQV